MAARAVVSRPRRPSAVRARLAQALLDTQRADGAWEIYYGAPNGDINATVEAYAALRCSGFSADHPALLKAQTWIESKGGLRNIRVFTRYWLALIGEWPWEKTPNLPPEVIWLPLWFPLNIYHFAQWARATLMPLAVLSARRPARPLPPERRLDALFPGGRAAFDYDLPKNPTPTAGTGFSAGPTRFCTRCRVLGGCIGFGGLRGAAIRHVLEWIIRHQDADGGWGGIQPPWIYSLMALHAEGYALTHPVMAKGLAALDDAGWRVDVGDATFIQATNSPVWDTMLTLLAFDDAGVLRDAGGSGGKGRRLAAAAAGARSRRLVDKTAEGEAGRLEFRIRQRFLSRHRRHRRRADRAGAVPRAPRFFGARRRGGDPAGGGLADRHAEQERRLGRLRQGQHQHAADQNPFLRFRRGAGPALGGRDRACDRGLRQARDFPRAIPPWFGRSPIFSTSRSRTARGSGAGASITSTGPARCCRRSRPSART